MHGTLDSKGMLLVCMDDFLNMEESKWELDGLHGKACVFCFVLVMKVESE